MSRGKGILIFILILIRMRVLITVRIRVGSLLISYSYIYLHSNRHCWTVAGLILDLGVGAAGALSCVYESRVSSRYKKMTMNDGEVREGRKRPTTEVVLGALGGVCTIGSHLPKSGDATLGFVRRPSEIYPSSCRIDLYVCRVPSTYVYKS